MRTKTCVSVIAFAAATVASSGAFAQDVTVTPPPNAPPPPPAAPAPEGTTSATPAPTAAPTGEETSPAGGDVESAPPPQSGWDPDAGFVLRSNDKQWKLRVGLQAAYKFEPVWNEGEKASTRGSIAFLRPLIEGSIYKEWIRFWTSFDFTSNPPYVLDTYFEIQPEDAYGVRAGQFWTPISRHEQYGPQQLLFPEFDLVADYFWPGRDKGVMLFGLPMEKKFEYYVGLFSGSPLRTSRSISGNWEVMARVAFNPLGPTGGTEFPYIVPRGKPPAPFRASIGLNGWTGKVQTGVENFNPATFRFDFKPSGEITKIAAGAAEVFIQGPMFAFLAEGYVRRTNKETAPEYTSVGAFGQLGVLVIPHLMDVGARLNWLNPSTDITSDQFWSIEGQTAFYIHNNNLVLKLRYGYGHQQSPTAENAYVTLPVGNMGKTHLATVQMNVFF